MTLDAFSNGSPAFDQSISEVRGPRAAERNIEDELDHLFAKLVTPAPRQMGPTPKNERHEVGWKPVFKRAPPTGARAAAEWLRSTNLDAVARVTQPGVGPN
jgi:hypothetical protein